MSALLGNFLAGDQIESGMSLSDDTILPAVPFSELTRHACHLGFRRNQSSSYACGTG
jgi:hypothetical protein